MAYNNINSNKDIMKYSQLKVDDYFFICREPEKTLYIKKECYFVEAYNEKVAYRKLNGGTKVERVRL